MGFTVEARDPENAIEKGIGVKGDKFDPVNKMVENGIDRGAKIHARVTPVSRSYEYGPETLERSFEDGYIQKDYEKSANSGERTGLTSRKG